MSTLPEELLLSLNDRIPCRELQIRQLATLLFISSPSTIVVHGVEATGKSLIIQAVLEAVEIPSAVIRSRECITTRHLLERTLSSVQDALRKHGVEEVDTGDGRCESISAFLVQLQQLLDGKGRFILVFDGIDRQREAAPTLLPAIARLGELILNLSTILITTTLSPHLLHHSPTPHIHFPPYTRAETLSILSRTPLLISPPSSPSQSSSIEETDSPTNDSDSLWLWTRFTAAVWDSLGQSYARDLLSFRRACTRLWPPFIQPILDNHYGARELSKLMVRNRSLFQSEAALTESIVPISTSSADITKPVKSPPPTLPYYPTHLLLAAYLTSHSPPRHDITLFSKTSLSRRKKRRGGTALSSSRPSKQKHRKISRRLLGPQPFLLERMLAIFHAILPHERKGGGADVMGMVATLVGLRLIVSAGGGDVLGEGGGKWRCGLGWEFVREVARGVRFDIESYLIE